MRILNSYPTASLANRNELGLTLNGFFIQKRTLINTPNNPNDNGYDSDDASVGTTSTENHGDLSEAMKEQLIDYNRCTPGGQCHDAALKKDSGQDLDETEASSLKELEESKFRGIVGGETFDTNVSYEENCQRSADYFARVYMNLHEVWESGERWDGTTTDSGNTPSREQLLQADTFDYVEPFPQDSSDLSDSGDLPGAWDDGE